VQSQGTFQRQLYHFRWLVVVEGCNTIVDQFPQGKHVLGFFGADFVFVFSSDPISVNNS